MIVYCIWIAKYQPLWVSKKQSFLWCFSWTDKKICYLDTSKLNVSRKGDNYIFLTFLKASIVHCDLKPENILLK
jgi:hypothetical protein